jgi:hypothetical protein
MSSSVSVGPVDDGVCVCVALALGVDAVVLGSLVSGDGADVGSPGGEDSPEHPASSIATRPVTAAAAEQRLRILTPKRVIRRRTCGERSVVGQISSA